MKIVNSVCILLALGIAFLDSTVVFAQQSACQSVYAASTRNISKDVDISVANEIYFDLYCEQSGEVRSSFLDTGVNFPIKGIPIEVSASGNWSKEEMNKFCKIGSERNNYRKDSYKFSNTVVTDALQSFNECVALERKALIITHSESRPSGVTINARRTDSQTNIIFNAFTFEEDHLECTSTDFSEDGLAKPITGDRRYKVGRNFAVSCKRKQIVENGKAFYPRTSLTLSTTDGSYTVNLESDSNFGFSLASQAYKNYSDALAAKTAAEIDLKKIRSAANTLQPIGHHMMHIGDKDHFVHMGVHYLGCPLNYSNGKVRNTLFESKAKSVCGSNRVAGLAPIHENREGECGNYLYEFVCMPNL